MGHVNTAFATSLEIIPAEPDPERINGKALNSVAPPNSTSLPNTNFESPKIMSCVKLKCHWFANGLILLFMVGFIVIFEFNILPFRSLGFRCKDPNLSHSFRGDTIPFTYLLAITITAPLISVILVESILTHSTQTYVTSKKERSLKQGWFWYGQYCLGFLILVFLVEMMKSLIAEPRPHFFETCRPDKAINCTTEYITDYKCTNKNKSEWTLRDSYHSFPSGHAAFGIYMATFMACFFQVRIPRSNYLVVPCLHCLFLLWGLTCALSRITDRRHHWWDVLVGSIIGLLMAAFAVKVFCQNFQCQSSKLRKPDKNSNDTGNDINHAWNKKLLSSVNNCSQPSDDRELREVK